jgi:hypothetical protein
MRSLLDLDKTQLMRLEEALAGFAQQPTLDRHGRFSSFPLWKTRRKNSSVATRRYAVRFDIARIRDAYGQAAAALPAIPNPSKRESN